MKDGLPRFKFEHEKKKHLPPWTPFLLPEGLESLGGVLFSRRANLSEFAAHSDRLALRDRAHPKILRKPVYLFISQWGLSSSSVKIGHISRATATIIVKDRGGLLLVGLTSGYPGI